MKRSVWIHLCNSMGDCQVDDRAWKRAVLAVNPYLFGCVVGRSLGRPKRPGCSSRIVAPRGTKQIRIPLEHKQKGVDRESESRKTAFPINIVRMSTRGHRRLRIRIFGTAQKTCKAFPLIAVNHRGSRAFGSAQALRSAFCFVYALGTTRLIYISFHYFFCLFHRSSRISILMRKTPFGVYWEASIIGPNRLLQNDCARQYSV